MKKFVLSLLVLALMAGGALAQTVDPGWSAFVIRAATATPNNQPVIQGSLAAPGAVEFLITEGGQKAALGTNLINGAKVSQIASLHVDRLDNIVASGSAYAPYFNIWVTDGAGHYAVIANEPSNPEWSAADRWDITSWDMLKTKSCKVFETPGWSDGTSWVHTYTGKTTGLVFQDIANLVIAAPSPAYIADSANGVGGGAPDVLGTNVAYGYNWIFGDTLANYLSGNPGFIVANYAVSAPLPVVNVTQGTQYGAIQAAIDAANPGDAITVAAGHYVEQLHITQDNLSVTGAGVGATFVDSPTTLALSFTTSAANKPVVFVDHADGVALAGLTVDGLGRGNLNYRFQGVGYYNAGGSMNNVRVANVMDTPFSGSQHGNGVYCYADDGGPHAVAMTDVLVDGFQKTGVVVNGAGMTGTLLRVTTTGQGPTTITAQNGIQAGFGAVVTATNCMVSGTAYIGTENASATGFLSVAGATAHFVGCTATGCQTSAYFSDAGGAFNNSQVVAPLGDALYAYSGGAKALASDRPLAQPFDSGLPNPANKSASAVSINGSTFTGTGAANSWGPSAYGSGTVSFTMTNSTVTGWDFGVVFYNLGGGIFTSSVHGNTISGNLSYGAYSNASGLQDCTNNNWGSASGPTNAALNPTGTGDDVSGGILFTPWTGRTTSVVARTATPTGPFFLEGTPAIGVDGDGAAGFGTGSIKAPNAYTRYVLDPEVAFGRPVTVGEIYRISYLTKKGTLHTVDASDWYLYMYTDPYVGGHSSWYGNRISSEPYFSQNLVETAAAWNQWTTDAGANNRLRFFDSSPPVNYFGSYTDGFLSDLSNNAIYSSQTILMMGLSVGTGWAAGFNGQLDGLVIELNSGQTLKVNFESGNAVVAMTPATSGPINCSQSQTLTVSMTKTDGMPDVFGFNAVVRVTGTGSVNWGPVTSLAAFGGTTQFFSFNQGDGSYMISGTTVGSPTQPISAAGTTPLFSIQYFATGTGTANITFDSFSLRDPNNAPIPSITTGATIAIDCTAPAAVTAITAAPGHNKVSVGWTHTGVDVANYEVYRGLWTNGTIGVSAYPEYDDLVGNVIPARPATRALAAAGPAWVLAGTVPAGTTTFTDPWATAANRGVYYYEVFAVDVANNPSAPAAANKRATNYWLGDVDGVAGNMVPNGLVNVADMTVLGTWFGTASVALNSAASPVDVGPTDTYSRLGIPTTDSKINFEDLMVFAMNFGVVTAAKSDAIVGTSVDLAWVRYDNGSMALRLVDGSGLKGVRVTANKPVGALVAGGLLDEQSELTFAQNIGETLDANVAVMGVNTTFTGTGDLFVIPAGEAIEAGDLTITARAIDNSKMEVKLTSAAGGQATPRVFALNDNYPNPFNPMTKISFSLPETQKVRLTVYSLDGRKVATLLDETRGAGLHEIVWTGRDDAGQSVASGTYFYRVDAGPYSDVRKMTLMK